MRGVALSGLALLISSCGDIPPNHLDLNLPQQTEPSISCSPPRPSHKPVGKVNGYEVWQEHQVGMDESGQAHMMYAIRPEGMPCAFRIASSVSNRQRENGIPSLSVIPLGAYLEFDRLTAKMQSAADDFIAECRRVEPARRYCGAGSPLCLPAWIV